MGDSGQGPLLPNQVQGVKAGTGVDIDASGFISFEAESAEGVVKLNNESGYNNYVWPTSPPSVFSLLTSNGTGTTRTLSWTAKPSFGYGIEFSATTGITKSIVEQGAFLPDVGSALEEATEGSLFWDIGIQELYLRSGGSWVQVNQSYADYTEALLTGTYHLFVNPEIGSDEYITGMSGGPNPLPNQQLTCGYTPQKPFQTIARAALEVARIQNGSGFDPFYYDRIVIHCSAGEHIIHNGFGDAIVTEWDNLMTPTSAQLQAMNNDVRAGLILPRGVSVIGEDLRKTIIRPSYVPDKTGDIEDDRASIFRITGGGFFFNFTFKDKVGLTESHHLLDCFSFVSDDDLENYYEKVQVTFDQSILNTPANPGETEIVAPKPAAVPVEATDGTIGSSPYIFNCSVRSMYGLCGINADGSSVTGFKSMVTAQFTGVSLQRDLSCWQRYNPVTQAWVDGVPDYDAYIELSPNDLRMRIDRRNFHVRAVNNAFIQEVSVFAIGQGIHHWVDRGGEISVTNSNSSFGGCAALAQGYKTESFPQDIGWNTSYIDVGTNLAEQTTTVTKIFLGVIDGSTANNATTITLDQALETSDFNPDNPVVLQVRGYSFKAGSYLWVENANGKDFRAPLTSTAWESASPNQIDISSAMVNENAENPTVDNPLAGKKVYIRRLVDTRSYSNRLYSLICQNSSVKARTPIRDYVVQTTLGSGGSVVDELPESSLIVINKAIPRPKIDPIITTSQIILGRANGENLWSASVYYRKGDTVRYNNKHYTCVSDNVNKSCNDTLYWNESFVHMQSDYNAYDYFGNVAPVIYFDNDTSGTEVTTNCGFSFTGPSACWTSDPEIERQYKSCTDYQGVLQFLIGIGFTESEAEEILAPRGISGKRLDPADSGDMLGYVPSGAANACNNWPLEFRRPSTLRVFGHAWEWAGYLNYTKALPEYQGELSLQNQFTYYFTNELGGRVYASGFNQEGYLVTPAGLTDLSTGETLSSTDLGNSNLGLEIPTFYDFLEVGTLRVNTLLEGAPDFAPSFYTNLFANGLGVYIEQLSTIPSLKIKLPDAISPPTAGTSADQAIDGSVYWDKSLGALFVRYNDGTSTQWVQVDAGAPFGGGSSGAMVFPTPAQAALQTPVNTFSSSSTPIANSYNNITYVYNSSKGVWQSVALDIPYLPTLP